MALIDILLATYNGAPWLAEQLDSLLAQTETDWRVLAHDDGSQDTTLTILRDYQQRHPRHFQLLDDGVRCGGAKENFHHLMQHSSADYVMFCDQDDVWDSDKIAVSLARMREVEAAHPGVPVLVHSDLRVVDAGGQLLHASMFACQRLPRRLPALEQRLVLNNVTGCTVMLNRRALQVSLPMAACALMHDWWAACRVVQAGGQVELLPRSTLGYRQHGRNSVGARTFSLVELLQRLRRPLQSWQLLAGSWRQAQALLPGISRWQLLQLKLRFLLQRLRGAQ